jgi:hypothetical protein
MSLTALAIAYSASVPVESDLTAAISPAITALANATAAFVGVDRSGPSARAANETSAKTIIQPSIRIIPVFISISLVRHAR